MSCAAEAYWARHSPDLNVFVFQCADTDLYALSLYSSGGNLPVAACAGAWHYRGCLLMTKQTTPIEIIGGLAFE